MTLDQKRLRQTIHTVAAGRHPMASLVTRQREPPWSSTTPLGAPAGGRTPDDRLQ